MKEWENWCRNPDVKFYLNDYGPFSASKAGWKAALKWALTTQGKFDWRFCPMISPSIIEKELESE